MLARMLELKMSHAAIDEFALSEIFAKNCPTPVERPSSDKSGWRKNDADKQPPASIDISGKAPGGSAVWQTLEHLSHGCCKWPVSETANGRVLFCAEPVAHYALAGASARSYCQHHAKMGRERRLALNEDARRKVLADLSRAGVRSNPA